MCITGLKNPNYTWKYQRLCFSKRVTTDSDPKVFVQENTMEVVQVLKSLLTRLFKRQYNTIEFNLSNWKQSNSQISKIVFWNYDPVIDVLLRNKLGIGL